MLVLDKYSLPFCILKLGETTLFQMIVNLHLILVCRGAPKLAGTWIFDVKMHELFHGNLPFTLKYLI